MKHLNTFFYLCCIALCFFTLTSCGGDEDTNGGDSGYTSKRITSIHIGYTESQDDINFTYDKQGRVIEMIANYKDKGSSISSEITKYTYSDTRIIKEVTGYSNYTYYYYLSNGRIVREERTGAHIPTVIVYTYDERGYVSSRTLNSKTDYNNEIETINYTWVNGYMTEENMTSKTTNNIGDVTTDFGKATYTYTNIPWLKGMFSYYEEDYWDSVLRGMGYYGNLPKCLPATNSRDNGTPYINETYEHSLSEGNVSSLKVYKKERTYPSVTYTFTWQ